MFRALRAATAAFNEMVYLAGLTASAFGGALGLERVLAVVLS